LRLSNMWKRRSFIVELNGPGHNTTTTRESCGGSCCELQRGRLYL
jgi:hypothetical protein